MIDRDAKIDHAVDVLLADLLPTFDAVMAAGMPLNLYSLRTSIDRVTRLDDAGSLKKLVVVAALALLLAGNLVPKEPT